MVENATTQCRRDLLWQRMLITTNMAEEEGRRKRRSERIDPDQEKDTVKLLGPLGGLGNLTYSALRVLAWQMRRNLSVLDHNCLDE